MKKKVITTIFIIIAIALILIATNIFIIKNLTQTETENKNISMINTNNETEQRVVSKEENKIDNTITVNIENIDKPIVYMTTDISADGLIKIYEALGRKATGNVAVKISTGEVGSNYLRTDLIGDLVKNVNGTIVECNTAYGGQRASTARHMQLAADYGYTSIANVDIMDANGSSSIPVNGGKHITENLIGANFENYDFCIVLSHFKGHRFGGFGGAIKNMSVGIASSSGKCLIHSAGRSKTDRMLNTTDMDDFQETMAESAKSISDYMGEKIIYINVMNNLSIDCDCNSYPTAPEMDDIGILASLDSLALDQACVDLASQAEHSESLVNRMEQRHAYRALEYGEEIGLGSRKYQLVSID